MKQFLSAKQLVIMPLSSLHRLADEEAGDPTSDGRRLTLINNTSRCGSTLLCQILNAVPGVRALSEPWTLNHAHADFVKGRIDMVALKSFVRSIVRVQCKQEKCGKASHVVLKTCSIGASVIPLVAEMFPSAQLVFNTRNLKGTMESFMQIESSLPRSAKAAEYLTGKVIHGAIIAVNPAYIKVIVSGIRWCRNLSI